MSLETLPFSQNAIEVTQDDGWKTAGNNSFLYTQWLSPCIGILLYDPLRYSAALGHTSSVSHGEELLLFKVNSFLRESEKDKVLVYLRGGAPIKNMPSKIVNGNVILEDRIAVLRVLEVAGLQDDQLDILWLNNPFHYANMGIDTATGQFYYSMGDNF